MNFLYVCITQSTKSSGTMYDYIQGEVTELTQSRHSLSPRYPATPRKSAGNTPNL